MVLEMSGNPGAIRTAIASMAHGGRLAQLGIPSEPISLDLDAVIFKMLTISGIYGRQMYETWYKMSVMLQSGLDIRPAITHRFAFRDHEAAFATAGSGEIGQGHHGLEPLMSDARGAREPGDRRATTPTRWPSCPTSWPSCAHGTSTGRCAS